MGRVLLAGFAIALGCGSTGAVAKAVITPAQVARHHMEAADAGDLEAIMADYAPDAVQLKDGSSLQGKAAIAKMFEGFATSRVGKGPVGFVTDKVWEEGKVGYAQWHLGALTATEVFIVEKGKIKVQAVYMHPPAK